MGGGDGSVLSVYVSKNSKRLTLEKLGDVILILVVYFLLSLVSNHGDYNNEKFTVGDEFFLVVFVEA